MSETAAGPSGGADPRQRLRADCSRCVGLCCVAPAFAASADFAFAKPAGQPCRHLGPDDGCGIHERLRDSGFPGCAVFDCFGAGQQVTQVTFGGSGSWRSDPGRAQAMFAVLPVMRQLHELLWYLAEARGLVAAGDVRDRVELVRQRTERLCAAGPDELLGLDPTRHRREVGELLGQVSRTARADRPGPDHRGADLIGARLRRADLRSADLRGAYLLGADLRESDLDRADLLGADLRAADVRGARLAGALFLTQPQLDAARGDAATSVPPALQRPRHWPGDAVRTHRRR